MLGGSKIKKMKDVSINEPWMFIVVVFSLWFIIFLIGWYRRSSGGKNRKKTLSELRAESQYFLVVRSLGLFGRFSTGIFNDVDWDMSITVLARNPKEAALRAYKRGYGREQGANFSHTTKNWARWAVRPLDKPDNFRHITYLD